MKTPAPCLRLWTLSVLLLLAVALSASAATFSVFGTASMSRNIVVARAEDSQATAHV